MTSLGVWGDNTYGQASVLPGLTNVTAAAAGEDFCLALTGGKVAAWGTSAPIVGWRCPGACWLEMGWRRASATARSAPVRGGCMAYDSSAGRGLAPLLAEASSLGLERNGSGSGLANARPQVGAKRRKETLISSINLLSNTGHIFCCRRTGWVITYERSGRNRKQVAVPEPFLPAPAGTVNSTATHGVCQGRSGPSGLVSAFGEGSLHQSRSAYRGARDQTNCLSARFNANSPPGARSPALPLADKGRRPSKCSSV